MHDKERVLAPVLESQLGVKSFVPKDFDTDCWGSFSGETERSGNALEAARNKCNAAMDYTGADLAVASEGSFGAHPTLLFVPADEELLLLIDRKNNLEIVARTISTETNFAGQPIANVSELLDFARKAQFPEHGLLIRNAEKETAFLQKGIQSNEELISAYESCHSAFGTAFVETDMRAFCNPLRMKVIAQTAALLVEKILSKCPNCGTPGFDIVEKKPGLPCLQCAFPTKAIRSVVYRCVKCNFEETKGNPSGKKGEDPMYCDICNP
jgi:hypothetical protein